MVDDIAQAHSRGYSKGYAAGAKRRRREEVAAQVKNDRFLKLTSAVIQAGMRGGWGEKTDDVFKKYTLQELESMAIKSARRMVGEMEVF
jgi:hypothetical protein